MAVSEPKYTATTEKKDARQLDADIEWEEGLDLQLKLGPGKDCMMAKPKRKSREDTHPSVTMYLNCTVSHVLIYALLIVLTVEVTGPPQVRHQI
jgi:hypothetical protein